MKIFAIYTYYKCIHDNTHSTDCCWSIFLTGLPIDTSLIISATAAKSGKASV